MCDSSGREDEELLPFFGEMGHGGCSAELHAHRNPEVLRICRCITEDVIEADDCAGETWLRVRRDKGEWEDRGTGSARWWINAIAASVAMSTRDRNWRRRRRFVPLVGDSPGRERDDSLIAQVAAAFVRLPPLDQAAVILTRGEQGWGGHTLEESAGLLGLSGPPAVCRLLPEVLRRLRDDLGGPTR